MKVRNIALGFAAGLAAVTFSAAPIASASPNPGIVTDNGRTTTTDKNGHNAIVVHPPNVSPPNTYGPFGSFPAPLLLF